MSSQRREPAPAAIESMREAQQEAEIPDELLTHVAAGSAAQVVIAVVIVLAVCYIAKLVMITLASALLLAFVLEPIVWHLQRWHVPRTVGSFLAVILLLGSVHGVAHFSYNSTLAFLNDLPKYSDKLSETMMQFRQHTEQLKRTTEAVLPESEQERDVVKVKPQSTWTDWLTNSASGLGETLIALSFIPFLTYFMLSWKDRMHLATVKLFRPENRRTAYETLDNIASMLHGFIVGNLMCGFFIAGLSVLAFACFKLPYFSFWVSSAAS
jgi:predicted PurR-regulated permease PerM